MMPRYTRTPGPLPHFQTPCGDAATLYVDPPETDGHPVDLRPEGRDAEADKIRSINREILKIIQGLGIWQRDPADGELNGVLFGIENTGHEPHRGLVPSGDTVDEWLAIAWDILLCPGDAAGRFETPHVGGLSLDLSRSAGECIEYIRGAGAAILKTKLSEHRNRFGFGPISLPRRDETGAVPFVQYSEFSPVSEGFIMPAGFVRGMSEGPRCSDETDGNGDPADLVKVKGARGSGPFDKCPEDPPQAMNPEQWVIFAEGALAWVSGVLGETWHLSPEQLTQARHAALACLLDTWETAEGFPDTGDRWTFDDRVRRRLRDRVARWGPICPRDGWTALDAA